MRRVRINRVLLPRLQMNLMPHSIKILRPSRRTASRRHSPLPRHVKRNASPPAAKCLFLPEHAANRRMPMFRTSLPRNHHQFLSAHSLGVHISKNLQPRRRQLAQTKIRHFHPLLLLRRDQNPRLQQQLRSSQRNFTVFQCILTPPLYNITVRGVRISESRARDGPSEN